MLPDLAALTSFYDLIEQYRDRLMQALRSGFRHAGAAVAAVLCCAFLVVTRPTSAPTLTAHTREALSGYAADLSQQRQLAPNFAVSPEIHAMLPADVRASGRLSVAMSVGIAPINFPGEAAEEVKGLMPDIASALEQILGVRFERTIYPSTASQLLALQSGRARLAISTNADTPERQGSYDFIDYMVAANSLVMQEGDRQRLGDLKQLCGESFGEVKGSVSLLPNFEAMCRGSGLPAPRLLSFDDAPTMMLALASRRILCFVGSPFNTIYLQSQGVALADMPIPGDEQKYLGLTSSKRDAAITTAVFAAMKKMAAAGYYREALKRWGLADYGLEPGMNLARPDAPDARAPLSKGIQ